MIWHGRQKQVAIETRDYADRKQGRQVSVTEKKGKKGIKQSGSCHRSLSFFYFSSPNSSACKESACDAEDPSLILGSGRSPGEGIGYPLQYSWASVVAQLVKNPTAMREIWVQSLVGKIPWRREQLPTSVFWPGEFHGLYSPWGHKGFDTQNNWGSHHGQQKSPKCSTWMQSQKRQNDLCSFPRQTIEYHSYPSVCPNQSLKKLKLNGFMKTYKTF